MPKTPELRVPRRRRSRVKGFPKILPCLVCDKPRVAQSPANRIHASCRKARLQQYEPEFTTLEKYHRQEEPEA